MRHIRHMRENENRIDEEHRKELLRFLLVKTAAVRQGVKPAELLRDALDEPFDPAFYTRYLKEKYADIYR